MQPHAETRGKIIVCHERRAIDEVPARARTLAKKFDQSIERQAFGVRERHRFTDGLYNARTHDLIGGLGRLAGTARAEIGDVFSHGCENGLRTLELRLVAADHDGERGVARAFDAAADRTIEKTHAERGELS